MGWRSKQHFFFSFPRVEGKGRMASDFLCRSLLFLIFLRNVFFLLFFVPAGLVKWFGYLIFENY